MNTHDAILQIELFRHTLSIEGAEEQSISCVVDRYSYDNDLTFWHPERLRCPLRCPGGKPLIRIPTTTTSLSPDDAAKVLRLVDALEELQDVQEVYTSLEMDEAALAALSD